MTHLLTDGLVPVRDTELYVSTTGSGPALLVMHGGLGVDSSYFRPWLDALGDVAELTYYDHRGNGRSARPPLDDVDHGTWVADADALRERLGHEQVVLLGHSYGGFLALRYALTHPERVRGLILMGTAAVMEHWDLVHAGLSARNATAAQLRAFQDRPFVDDADLATTMAALMPLYFHRPDPDLLADIGSRIAFSREGSVAGGRCMGDYDLRAALASVAVPALVLGGRHDFIMPPEATIEPLAAALPHAELVVFEDSGHFPFIEQNEDFLRVVRRWFAALRARP